MADALSRWPYPACAEKTDLTFHGSVDDAKKVAEMDREMHLFDGLISQIVSGTALEAQWNTTLTAEPDVTRGGVTRLVSWNGFHIR